MWLKAQNLPHTLRRTEEGWHLELAPAAAKKKCVFSLAVSDDDTGARLDITFSQKARLRGLLTLLPPCANTPLSVCDGFLF